MRGESIMLVPSSLRRRAVVPRGRQEDAIVSQPELEVMDEPAIAAREAVWLVDGHLEFFAVLALDEPAGSHWSATSAIRGMCNALAGENPGWRPVQQYLLPAWRAVQQYLSTTIARGAGGGQGAGFSPAWGLSLRPQSRP